jgi:hypothetical protein
MEEDAVSFERPDKAGQRLSLKFDIVASSQRLRTVFEADKVPKANWMTD